MLRLVETCSHIPENNLQLRLWLPRSFWGFVGTWSIFNSAGQSENIDVPLIHCGQLDYCVSQVIWIQSVDDLIRSFPLTPQWPGSLSVIVGAGVRERWREGGRGGGEMESEKKRKCWQGTTCRNWVPCCSYRWYYMVIDCVRGVQRCDVTKETFPLLQQQRFCHRNIRDVLLQRVKLQSDQRAGATTRGRRRRGIIFVKIKSIVYYDNESDHYHYKSIIIIVYFLNGNFLLLLILLLLIALALLAFVIKN